MFFDMSAERYIRYHVSRYVESLTDKLAKKAEREKPKDKPGLALAVAFVLTLVGCGVIGLVVKSLVNG